MEIKTSQDIMIETQALFKDDTKRAEKWVAVDDLLKFCENDEYSLQTLENYLKEKTDNKER